MPPSDPDAGMAFVENPKSNEECDWLEKSCLFVTFNLVGRIFLSRGNEVASKFSINSCDPITLDFSQMPITSCLKRNTHRIHTCVLTCVLCIAMSVRR